ncbi:MAG: efflux RND transporter periplasmic adaptor subunit [Patescibacteria group bacterium]|nr:efflux RND transporter periplasmic adaptor subunit [Patescibacteria group bacterium]
MTKFKLLFARIKSLILNHKKISLVVIAILIISGYFLVPKSQKPILTESASIKDIVKTVSVTGKVDSDNSVNLTFQAGGTLDYLGVKVGDTVQKGQLIASLNKDNLWAAFRQAQQDFTAAKAASEQYYSGNTNATESYDQKVKRTALDATQNKAYDNMVIAQKAVSNYNLYSPIDGIITRTDADTAGMNVTALTIFTVTDPKSLVFKLEVDQSDVGLISLGQKVKIVLDAFPGKTLMETVVKIDFVSHTTSSNGTAYYVNSNLPLDQNYRVGMSGNADVIIATKNQVLAIPASSVMDDNTVYKRSEKKYKKTKVKLGLQNDTQAQVLSGLSKGDTVVIDPTSVPQNLIVKN